MFQVFVIAGFLSAVKLGHSVLNKGCRQDPLVDSTGIDVTVCVTDADTGLCCVEKYQTVTSHLECTHKNTEQCHLGYSV